MEHKKSKTNGIKRVKSNSTRFIQYEGLSAVTIFDSRPYFFLFADIDKKEVKQLERVLWIYQENNLSCYWYETTQGFHVVTPVLLNLKTWAKLTNQLKPATFF